MPHRLAAAAMSAALLLSGCSGAPQPKVAPSESPTPTATPTTADESVAEDEAEFISRFFAGISQAIATGDASLFQVLADDTCHNCAVIADNLKGAYAEGGRIVGGGWTVVSTEPVEDPSGASVWDVRIQTARERWVDRRGETVKTIAPSIQTLAVSLRRAGDEWRVREMQLR
ncbi:DUF6318 family protein [Nocardioides sp. SYSU DS0663]|uniref:DUF6318 family protein n=1 Tax=Nocardioides sp. SYSU DS0663 TaxID=3416445 RepID=UPI003F4B6B9B